jgi:protein-S-isoprenylcysteine O-methyltransferase Ste14
MEWIPHLELGWLNGWLLLVVYGLVFGGTVRSFPNDVIAKLYDRSNWSKTQRIITRIGKLLSIPSFILLALTPLKISTATFWVGIALFVLGLTGVVIALFNFKAMHEGQPATTGLYRISRNPQWVTLLTAFVGACLAIGSGIALVVFAILAVCYHFRILGEEQACLNQYGESYRAYMRRVPRYLFI